MDNKTLNDVRQVPEYAMLYAILYLFSIIYVRSAVYKRS